VIAAFGGVPPARAARAASPDIPIVFTTAGDPVAEGLVGSINHPGGNSTGVSFFSAALGAKMLNLLTAAAHPARAIGVLVNPAGVQNQEQLRPLLDAAAALRIEINMIEARSDAELEHAFSGNTQVLDGLIIVADQFLATRSDKIANYTKRQRIPAISVYREFAAAGGLMSYGASVNDAYRQAGSYVGRILKGASPSSLPIVQPTKFDMTVNVRTAKALGLELPPTLLALADEVIE
jgi:putative ABC transport system substrate-binding protein